MMMITDCMLLFLSPGWVFAQLDYFWPSPGSWDSQLQCTLAQVALNGKQLPIRSPRVARLMRGKDSLGNKNRGFFQILRFLTDHCTIAPLPFCVCYTRPRRTLNMDRDVLWVQPCFTWKGNCRASKQTPTRTHTQKNVNQALSMIHCVLFGEATGKTSVLNKLISRLGVSFFRAPEWFSVWFPFKRTSRD